MEHIALCMVSFFLCQVKTKGRKKKRWLTEGYISKIELWNTAVKFWTGDCSPERDPEKWATRTLDNHSKLKECSISTVSYKKVVFWSVKLSPLLTVGFYTCLVRPECSSYYAGSLHLKVRVSGSGCPLTVSSKSSEKVPNVRPWKVTPTVWQAPEGTTPSSGCREKQRPKVVSDLDSVNWASISPLLDTGTWTKGRCCCF